MLSAAASTRADFDRAGDSRGPVVDAELGVIRLQVRIEIDDPRDGAGHLDDSVTCGLERIQIAAANLDDARRVVAVVERCSRRCCPALQELDARVAVLEDLPAPGRLCSVWLSPASLPCLRAGGE